MFAKDDDVEEEAIALAEAVIAYEHFGAMMRGPRLGKRAIRVGKWPLGENDDSKIIAERFRRGQTIVELAREIWLATRT